MCHLAKVSLETRQMVNKLNCVVDLFGMRSIWWKCGRLIFPPLAAKAIGNLWPDAAIFRPVSRQKQGSCSPVRWKFS